MIEAMLSDLARALDRRLVGADAEVQGVSTDSRSIVPGNLFIALRGERFDGHAFLAKAKAAGAVGAIVDHLDPAVDLAQIEVSNTLHALGDIARRWRLCLPARVVAITGSNGKTTVKTMTAAILAEAGRTFATEGSLNNEIGLPMSICRLSEDDRFAVLEMGAGQPGDIEYLAAIGRPDVSLVNNIAPAHLERLGSLDGIARTKGAIYELMDDRGIAVLNLDDAFADSFRSRIGDRRVFGFSATRADADVRVDVLDSATNRIRLTTPLGPTEIDLAFAGKHNALNAAAATALALSAGANLLHVSVGLAKARPVIGRLNRLVHPSGAVLLDDSYNANPASIKAGIDALRLLPGQHWLALGDVKELGPTGPELHAEVGRYAAAAGVSRLFAVGELSRHTVAGFGSGGEHFPNQADLLARLSPALGAGITILIKGSHSSAMDRITRALMGEEDTVHAA